MAEKVKLVSALTGSKNYDEDVVEFKFTASFEISYGGGDLEQLKANIMDAVDEWQCMETTLQSVESNDLRIGPIKMTGVSINDNDLTEDEQAALMSDNWAVE
jgi:hypothetical protein